MKQQNEHDYFYQESKWPAIEKQLHILVEACNRGELDITYKYYSSASKKCTTEDEFEGSMGETCDLSSNPQSVCVKLCADWNNA